MNDRERNISTAMDWCVKALDILQAMTPEHAALCGLDMVRAWKRSLEAALERQPEQVQ